MSGNRESGIEMPYEILIVRKSQMFGSRPIIDQPSVPNKKDHPKITWHETNATRSSRPVA